MSYKLKTVQAHKSNFGAIRPYSSIKYIIFHYTAVDGDSDEGNSRYFQSQNRQVSAHYFVDDDSVTQSVPENYIAWSVGGSKWSDCPQTGGGKFYGIASNSNSISIEMCDTLKDGTHNVSEKTLKNASDLCRELMKKYNIDISHVIRHFDVNGKHCPAYFMDDVKWGEFKASMIGRYGFKNGKIYKTTSACYLRHMPESSVISRVKYKSLDATIVNKCKNSLGYAKFKKGSTFKLDTYAVFGSDVWGRMKHGYWVPLIYNGKVRAKLR